MNWGAPLQPDAIGEVAGSDEVMALARVEDDPCPDSMTRGGVERDRVDHLRLKLQRVGLYTLTHISPDADCDRPKEPQSEGCYRSGVLDRK
jgi:hypothetical protein